MRLHPYFWPAVACVIAIAGTLEVGSALGETQTWDEGIHIAAGYAYLTRGDFRWNDEHPPLAKLMSALPLKGLGLVLPVQGEAWRKNDKILLGIEFLYKSPVSADRILFMDEGRVIEDTTPQELFDNPREERTKIFLSKILH